MLILRRRAYARAGLVGNPSDGYHGKTISIIVKNYFADTLDEAMAIAPMGTEAGTFWMMVVSYWDQACAYLNYGLLHEDLFFETNGEFFFVWERVKPTIQEGRQRFSNPLFLAHLEKAANRYETWIEERAPGLITAMRQMMKQMAAQASKAA